MKSIKKGKTEFIGFLCDLKDGSQIIIKPVKEVKKEIEKFLNKKT